MLDVHPPHEAAHTWKDFFIHIATIVVGLLIAIGLEQIVEAVHHRHQAQELTEALKQESLENRAAVASDLEYLDAAIELFKLDAAKLDQTPQVKGQYDLVPVSKVKGFTSGFANTAWLSARDAGALSMLPHDTVKDYWFAEHYVDEAEIELRILFDALSDYSALTRFHKDGSIRSEEEKSRLLLAMNHIQGLLRHIRSIDTAFGAANEVAISGAELSPSKLNEYRQKYPTEPPY